LVVTVNVAAPAELHIAGKANTMQLTSRRKQGRDGGEQDVRNAFDNMIPPCDAVE
jgi:hypothetical protein